MEEININQSTLSNNSGQFKNTTKPHIKYSKLYLLIFTFLILIFLATVLYINNLSINKFGVTNPVVKQAFNLSNINISNYKNPSSQNLIYSKRDLNGFTSFISLDLKNNTKTLLFNSSQYTNQDKIFFSPKNNYLVSYKNLTSGKPNDNSSTTTLTLYDLNFKNPQVIYINQSINADNENLLEPKSNWISNSGNKMILLTTQPKYEHEIDAKGNRGTLLGYYTKFFLLDLKTKTYRIIDQGIFNTNISNVNIIGWSNDDMKVVVNFESYIKLFDLKTKTIKQISLDGVLESYLYNGLSNKLAYELISKSGDVKLLLRDLESDKEESIDKYVTEKNRTKSFTPLKWSNNGNELIFATTDGIYNESTKYTTYTHSYTLYNVDTKNKSNFSRPESTIAKFNRETYGVEWFAACVNKVNVISLNGIITESIPVAQPDSCGQITPRSPSLFTTDNP
jgi:hypothetical protein